MPVRTPPTKQERVNVVGDTSIVFGPEVADVEFQDVDDGAGA